MLFKYSFIVAFLLLSLSSFSQRKMRMLDELISNSESAWPLVINWISTSKNKVEILQCDSAKSKQSLWRTQVSIKSPMGAIIYNTGGLMIDYGWIRILGSGGTKIMRSLPDWNIGKSYKVFGENPSFLLIADDVIGGFFAMNGGYFGNDFGKIYYLSPDVLKWEPLNMNYSDFILFCLNGDLNKFYLNLRWKNWQKEISIFSGDRVFNFLPTLWSKEFISIEKSKKTSVPVEEQYKLNLDIRKQLGLEKK